MYIIIFYTAHRSAGSDGLVVYSEQYRIVHVVILTLIEAGIIKYNTHSHTHTHTLLKKRKDR